MLLMKASYDDKIGAKEGFIRVGTFFIRYGQYYGDKSFYVHEADSEFIGVLDDRGFRSEKKIIEYLLMVIELDCQVALREIEAWKKVRK